MYLVYYTTGSYDDYSSVNVFVTEHEYKAKFWCSKFDEILKRIKPRYNKAWVDFDDDTSLPKWFGKHGYTITQTNGPYYRKIELR